MACTHMLWSPLFRCRLGSSLLTTATCRPITYYQDIAVVADHRSSSHSLHSKISLRLPTTPIIFASPPTARFASTWIVDNLPAHCRPQENGTQCAYTTLEILTNKANTQDRLYPQGIIPNKKPTNKNITHRSLRRKVGECANTHAAVTRHSWSPQRQTKLPGKDTPTVHLHWKILQAP
jgi:hypothetical protein